MENGVELIAGSALREWVVAALRNVPGLPPILQAIHILCVAVVCGSIGVLQLRLAGIAFRAQRPIEMVGRFAPWLWGALLVALATGLPFILARPARYFYNPLFAIKLASLAAAVAIAVGLMRAIRRTPTGWSDPPLVGRLWALLGLACWLGVIFGGRWIAYADYLFWSE